MEGDKWHIIFRKELYMKKLDNFANCLDILKQADFDLADSNDIYRMGVAVQFNLTFELA